MGHPEITEWADFARGAASPEASRAMRRHLQRGCSRCHRLARSLRAVAAVVSVSEVAAPPLGTVRSARAIFPLRSLSSTSRWKLRTMARVFDSAVVPAEAGTRAADAPRRLLFESEGHLVDLAVTGGAADAAVKMNAVIKLGVIWNIVDSHPLDRFTCFPTSPNRLQQRRVGQHLRVTGHTGFGGRNPGKGGVLNRGVTVDTLDSVGGHVTLVAERHGLGYGVVG